MLTRIRLKGFKSFSGQTTLDFGPGVNVIVGPNGSGKSNLVEAVVWAFGEQRAGRLRAGGMGEVLHAGGGGAQAQIAEVELTLDSPGADPEEGAELAVSRRLTRAGDTKYAANGQTCRLLDVQDRLASRGLGPDTLAIIRQGQVDALVMSKPPDRRAMVEEAAGVAASKRRRRRAENKLKRVAQSIERARDLEGELASQERRLARQAGAAERAKRIDRELKLVQRALLDRRLETAVAEREAAAAKRTARGEARDTARERRDGAQAAAQALEQEREKAAKRVRDAEQLAMTVRAEAERVSGRAELAVERQREEGERAERLGRERSEAAGRVEELTEALSGLSGEIAEADESVAAIEERVAQAEAAAAVARRTATELRDDAARRTAALADLARERDELERDAERARVTVATATERLQAGDGMNVEALVRAERRDEISHGRAALWRERQDVADSASEDARSSVASANERRRTADARVRALPDPSERARRALAAAVIVQNGCEHAFAAALGSAVDAELVDSPADGVAALEGGAGSALTPAPARTAQETPIENARAMMDVVTGCPDAVQPHIERLLADCWLVDAFSDVPAGTEGVFVTRAGHAYHPDSGVLTAPGGDWADHAARERAVAELEAATDARTAAEREREAADAERARLAPRTRAAERSASRASERLASLRAQIASQTERREQARTEAEDAERRLAESAARGEEIAARTAALTAERSDEGDAAATARIEADTAQRVWREAQAALADASSRAAALRARNSELGSQLASAEAAATAPVPSADEDPLATRAAEQMARAAEKLAPLLEIARERAANCALQSRRIEQEMAEVRERKDRTEAALGTVVDEYQQAEISHAVACERVAEAERSAAEGPEPEEGEPIELPEDPDALAEHLDKLESRRNSIGMVNPLAAEERTEVRGRAEEIAEQIADLEAASGALEARMAQLDAAVAEGYDNVYEVLSERFTEAAELLFPGGSGQLTEIETEDGQAGIEIEVVPAGKRARPLSLLSGGEKSLVALAFCVALAMVRPAPFYILDEVEAALDDVNLRRFLGLVRSLASDTQFVLITHQQPTVEIADTLFGVTMGGDGASQILSRKLSKTVEGPAEPYVRRQLTALPGGRA